MGKVERSALPVLLSGLALAAAGCGGGNSVADKYATGVCSAIGSWATTASHLAHAPGGTSQAAVVATLKQFETVTDHLAAQIEAVPAPKTTDAAAIKKEIDRLATQIRGTASDVKVTQMNVSRKARLAAPALTALTQQFETLHTTAQATLVSLQGAQGELAGAFRGSSACKQLG